MATARFGDRHDPLPPSERQIVTCRFNHAVEIDQVPNDSADDKYWPG